MQNIQETILPFGSFISIRDKNATIKNFHFKFLPLTEEQELAVKKDAIKFHRRFNN